MIQIAEKINKLITESVNNEKVQIDFNLEHPADIKHGDYSTNVALILAKKISTDTGKSVNPQQVAKLITEKINTNLPPEIQKVEVAGPGFINFYLKSEFFQKSLNEIIEKEQTFGNGRRLKDQTVLVEYTDPNPLKQFHIGHLMSNTIGESIARLYHANGAKVIRMCYQGDVGLHVAKALYGTLKDIENFPDKNDSLERKMKFLSDAYVYGAKMFDGDTATEESKKEIIEINKKVYAFFDETKNTDSELDGIYNIAKKWSLQHFEEIYEKLGTKFNRYVMESSTYQIGENIVRQNIGKVFEESEGAIIYRGEKDGLHTRVFINSSDLPLYESKEIGLAYYKDRNVKHDQSVVITADEQKEYFKVVLSALSKIYPKISEKTTHITHGMMQFSNGKMSSRTGNVITGESLLEDIEKMVEQKISGREIEPEMKKKIKSEVAVAALKYSILKQAPGKNIIFDPEQALSFEGDSGPYVQYTYTRAKSIIEKALKEKKIPNPKKLPEKWETVKIEKLLYRFPELIVRALDEKAPHYISTYMTQLASEFNTYYSQNQVLDGSPEEGYKLAIVRAVMVVLRNSLTILGMKAPDRM